MYLPVVRMVAPGCPAVERAMHATNEDHRRDDQSGLGHRRACGPDGFPCLERPVSHVLTHSTIAATICVGQRPLSGGASPLLLGSQSGLLTQSRNRVHAASHAEPEVLLRSSHLVTSGAIEYQRVWRGRSGEGIGTTRIRVTQAENLRDACRGGSWRCRAAWPPETRCSDGTKPVVRYDETLARGEWPRSRQ